MSLLNITINGISTNAEAGTTILDACKSLNINIPTLCHLKLHDNKTENTPGSCRVCVVEVEGRRNLAPACSTPLTDGMKIHTNSQRVLKSRKKVLELMLSDHPADCLQCDKNLKCDLQKIASDLGIRENKYLAGEKNQFPKDTSNFSIIRDPNKCILCRRCETVCNKIQTVGVLSAINRGFSTSISTAFSLPLIDTNCTFCGQCTAVCPTGALMEVNSIDKVWNALKDTNKVVLVQPAPATRATLGEEFGMQAGTIVTKKLVAALRRLGFDKVFDTDFAADLTIMEEASELLHRLDKGENLPLITSCCPAWINFVEHEYHDLIQLPSTCKSPQQMFGAIAKTYFAEKMNIPRENIIVVSIMPCLAKKYECERPEMRNDTQDVDFVLSTRELAMMIKEAGIDLNSLEDEDFDDPLGASTGAAAIFGTTGGVMEAALRTAYEWVTKEKLEELDFESIRGLEGIKKASIDIKGTKLNIAISSGLGNARKLLDEMREGTSNYHFVEIMACPGGCINGGGQPYIHGDNSIIEKRMTALYEEDKNKPIRKSHENEYIKQLYDEFLEKPYSEKSHKLLHTHYTAKK